MIIASSPSLAILNKALIQELVLLAETAGQDILMSYEEESTLYAKADSSPLTAADLASHQRILEGLRALTPKIPVLSEESIPVDPSERLAWSAFWLVDPLDGTKEFLNRNGEFTVNIALIVDHHPVFGIVHLPAQGLTYVGHGEEGAYRLGRDRVKIPIHVQEKASHPLRVLGSRSHPAPDLDAYLQQQGAFVLEPAGSSLKFCRVAEGAADLYPRFGPTSEWDTAAGQAVLEAAGGRVIALDGARLKYNSKDSLLNSYFLAFGDLGRNWMLPQDESFSVSPSVRVSP